MASKKNKPIKGKKTKKSIPKNISDKELMKIQKELRETRNRSILLENDIKKLRDKLNPPAIAGPEPIAYKSFIFRCGKCVEKFSHTAKIDAIDHKVICPKCNEAHMLRLRPVMGGYHIVKLPKSIKQVK